MKDFISVGLFGLGNVGVGVVELLKQNQTLIQNRIGKELRITKAVVANINKDRGIDLSGIEISSDPKSIFDDPDIDIVIEVVGGVDLAETIVVKTLEQGKSVVTANKALLAEKSKSIFNAAYESSGFLGFEASVGGGIPIIRTLTDGFSGDEILEISGIINGTANYILSRMTEEGADFNDVLKDAQDKGYAEADPTFDIEGMDTAHKLIILMDIAFGGIFDYNDLVVEGITGIEPIDIKNADELGYRIKLLGKAKKTEKGIQGRVHPTMVADGTMLASVNGAFNAIHTTGNFVGSSVLHGQGAGSHPTASAIVGDVVHAALALTKDQEKHSFPLSVTKENLQEISLVSIEEIVTEYYLRFTVLDNVGVLAKISTVLSEHDISIRSVIQKTEAHAPEVPVSLVFVTHEAKEKNVRNALDEINTLSFVKEKTKLIRMDPE
ncbi:MAG: homoserine dehydrogenase [bacterium]